MSGDAAEPGGAPAVLVVEDQALIGLDLERQLARLGYRVLPRVASGEEAVAACAAAPPDIVLMDIFLAGPMDGIEAATEIHRARDVPVVFLSANSEPDTRQRARAAAPYGYLIKPFGERELAVTLELALAKHAIEARLVEQERWLTATLACLGEAVVATGPGGRIRLLNAAAERLLGVSAAEAEGQLLDAVAPVPPELLAGPEADAAAALNAWLERGAWLREDRFVRGQVRVLTDARGAARGLVLALRDETARRRADEQLGRMATALDAAGESVFITDAAGVIQYVNRAFCRLHGYQPEEAIGQTPGLLKSGRHTLDHYAELWAALRAGRPWQGEVWNRNKDGSLVYVRETIAPIRDLDGRVSHFVSIEHDMTQEVEASEALRASEARFRRAQRLEAVGRLAGSVAHDFNNVLTVIKGYAEFALRQRADDALLDPLEQIHDASLRGIALTRRLLSFSKRPEGAPQVLDLNEAIQAAVVFLRRLAGERIRLVADLDVDAPAVRIDPTQFEQLLLNLVVNARDAMPGGGRLSIETERADVVADPGQEYVALRVTDTGTGIAPEVQARVFEPFFTTKPHDEGSGLGLATVREVAERAGGWVEVQSAAGCGTTFSILLPSASGPPSPGPAAHPRSRTAARGGSETVLVVEDQEWVQLVARLLLENAGYRVVTAGDAAEALERHTDAVSLAVVDVVLPGAGGVDVARRLRERAPGLPVLYVSGHDDTLPEAAREDPLARFLGKPFDSEKLLALVRTLIDLARRS